MFINLIQLLINLNQVVINSNQVVINLNQALTNSNQVVINLNQVLINLNQLLINLNKVIIDNIRVRRYKADRSLPVFGQRLQREFFLAVLAAFTRNGVDCSDTRPRCFRLPQHPWLPSSFTLSAAS